MQGNVASSPVLDEKRILSKEYSITSFSKEPRDGDIDEDEEREFEKRTVRYIDWRILPVLSFVYSMALIDRINIGSASTAGMTVALGLDKDNRYSIVTCLYFVPYMLLQLPGNILIRMVGVRNLLTFAVFSWGSVQLAMGFINHWGLLLMLRLLLGVFEASFFPSLLFIISTWYKRHEVQKRLAVFYLIAVTSAGFSPILAYVFSMLDGKRGIAGWQWIFIIEGSFTLSLGFVTWFFIPDFPHKATFLSPRQKKLILKRIDDDRGDAHPDPLTWTVIKGHLGDWKLWADGVLFMCAFMPNYAQAYFLSIILKDFGWSKTKALLLTSAPYGPALISTMVVSALSDKHKHRSSYILGGVITTVVGLTLTAFAQNNSIRYFGAFLANAGNSAVIPTILAYASNNVVSHSKRSVQTAVTVCLGGFGGILASTVFRSQDSPRYIPGFSATMGLQGLLLLVLAILTYHFHRQNKLVLEGVRTAPLEGMPGFLYTL